MAYAAHGANYYLPMPEVDTSEAVSFMYNELDIYIHSFFYI